MSVYGSQAVTKSLKSANQQLEQSFLITGSHVIQHLYENYW